MDWQAVLQTIDELLFQQTGKHLDNLQREILQGVLNGEKYREIAQRYKCTPGHVKDEGAELWHILSEVFGEELNKSNFSATVERLGIANYQSPIIGNHVRVNNINLFSNSETAELDKTEAVNPESNEENFSPGNAVDKVLQTKLKTVERLAQLGLNTEQIAEAVDLPLSEVKAAME
ncbi:MAG TPA: hypothetical protein IGS52_02860 [Oscillatoriaceae cyanobacterium M33_DOE_052]|uniref:vWA-MoxR associated protein N-terminal HTH domain-containing protein n=1 Tax=Planktothricoides sp. SpSt-374 TaxID=2282167 RepID=A0A7C3VFH8_9CYAN|nr:hypothetical protein [Oscillatoriaceae cyanobacterium M33_DOE_052]